MTGISQLFDALTLRCKDITRLLSESMDRKLPWHLRAGIWFHHLFCIWCRRYGRQLRLIRQVLRDFPEKAPTPEPSKLPAPSRERIGKTLRDHSA